MPNWTTNAMACHIDDMPKIVNGDNQVDFSILTPMPDSLHQTEGSITKDAIAYFHGMLADDEIESYLYKGPRDVNGQLREPDIAGEDEFGRWISEEAVGYLSACHTVHIDGHDYIIERTDQFYRLGEIYEDNQARYGSYTWYGWSNENWGTKWNACDSYVEVFGDYALLTFQTAWSTLSEEMIATITEAFSHPFVLECTFEDEQDAVYNPLTQESYPPDESLLFEEVKENWDGDEYVYGAVKDMDEGYLESLF